MHTIKQREALSKRYNLDSNHFRFPRTEPDSLRRIPWAVEPPVSRRDGWLWLVVVICFAAAVAAAVGV